MMKRIITTLACLVLLLGAFSFASADTTGLFGSRGLFTIPPAPRLISPVREKADLTGKTTLEFKWSVSEFIGTQGFEFKLYKGYNTNADNLIFKQNCDQNTDSVQVESRLFENGQAYTWTLRRIALGGEKSDAAFSSFQAVK